jgi:hypothetical protein
MQALRMLDGVQGSRRESWCWQLTTVAIALDNKKYNRAASSDEDP